jgi:S-adenosylmethionine:tRNA ribosyltransferase-isomerase
MRVDALDYNVPLELVAQRPAAQREDARLMHLPAGGGEPGHHRVAELPDLVAPGSLVVVNDTRVIPARLVGRKRETGGRVEVFLVRRTEYRHTEPASGGAGAAEVWRALGRASKGLQAGTEIEVVAPGDDSPALIVRVLGREADEGLLEVSLSSPRGETVDTAIRACGRIPLPPYIKRDPEGDDVERYQTVVARFDGAVAAPTAGLHLTRGLLDRLALRGCEISTVTLHVGPGTFQPVSVDDLDRHAMHAEWFSVPPAAASAVDRARARGAPVVAIGTTTVRALESAADPASPGRVRASQGDTRLLIQPGYRWKVVDGLLTNFHLPRSTLLALACAFAGTARVLDAYQVAIARRYRLFSYGDAMLAWRPR